MLRRDIVKKLYCSLVAGLLLLAFALPASALDYTVYTDRAAWESALITGTFTETFDDAELHPYVNIDSTYSGSGVVDGVWHDKVSDTHGYVSTLEFTMPVYAFSADWDLANPGGEGGGVNMDFTFYLPGFNTLQVYIPETTDGFWGIVMDTLFTSVTITDAAVGSSVRETFEIDNLTWAHVPGTTATPIPGAVWLLGSGLFGLVGVRRKMKA